MKILNLLPIILICLGALYIPRLAATPLLGDAGVAGNRPEDVAANPANISKVDGNQLSIIYNPYQRSAFTFRNPGHPTERKEQATTGLSVSPGSFTSPENIPLKLSTKSESETFGVQFFALPPMPLTRFVKGYKLEEIPIIAFNQRESLDAQIDHLYLKGAASIAFAYQISKRIALGVGVNYFAADVGTTLSFSDTGEEFISTDISASQMDGVLGMRVNILPGTLGIGMSTRAYQRTKADVNVESGLLKESIDNGNESEPLDNFRLGFRLGFQRILLVSDVEYVKAKPEQGISLNDFTVKEREVYDTWAPRAGVTYRLNPTTRLLAGGRIQPARYGDGDPGSDGKMGFGGMDVTMVAVGTQALTPYKQYGGGVEVDLLKKEAKVKRKRKGQSQEVISRSRYSLTIGMGAVYKEAARGIDETGDVPGAYTQRTFTVPINLIYRY